MLQQQQQQHSITLKHCSRVIRCVLFVFCRSHASHRTVFVDGIVDVRDVQFVFADKLFDHGHRRHVAATAAADAHEAYANVVQTPPAAHNEVVLQHQPKPRRQRPKTAGAKDWLVQTSITGETMTVPPRPHGESCEYTYA